MSDRGEHCTEDFELGGRGSQTLIIPAQAGIHLDFDGCNMDSRFRGNDGWVLSRECRLGAFAGMTLGLPGNDGWVLSRDRLGAFAGLTLGLRGNDGWVLSRECRLGCFRGDDASTPWE